jgi:CRP-like cAMP-binding protein
MMSAKPDCFDCMAKNCSVLKNCDDHWLSIINDRKKVVRAREGQAVVSDGLLLSDFYFVFKGKMKVVAKGLYGKQQIKRLVTSGNAIGFRALARENILPVSVYALEDTALCSIDRQSFLDLLRENPDLMLDTLAMMAGELQKMEQRMQNLTTMNVREKTADALLYIHEVFGLAESGELDVSLSRQEIAEIAMTTKEQVSKCLSEFASEGKIEVKGKKIFLTNIDELKSLTGTFG